MYNAAEDVRKMKTDYQAIAIEGAFRLDPGVRTLGELRAKTDAVMLPKAPPVPDEIVISRELTKEILAALDHAAGFGAFIPRRIQNESVAEYAGSMRFDALNAAMRLRRAALGQGACT